MNYLVKHEEYIRYVEKHGTDKLDKNNRIWTNSKELLFKESLGYDPIEKLNEMFDGYKTDYNIEKINNDYLILFKTISEQEYRFDLIKVPTEGAYHLAFAPSNKDKSDISYMDVTDRKESLEVLNRLIWILKDINIDSEYCIGSTGTKKDNIYKYMLRDIEFEKRDTDYYPLGWGIYFRL
jgi:hypothetical protein